MNTAVVFVITRTAAGFEVSIPINIGVSIAMLVVGLALLFRGYQKDAK